MFWGVLFSRKRSARVRERGADRKDQKEALQIEIKGWIEEKKYKSSGNVSLAMLSLAEFGIFAFIFPFMYVP